MLDATTSASGSGAHLDARVTVVARLDGRIAPPRNGRIVVSAGRCGRIDRAVDGARRWVIQQLTANGSPATSKPRSAATRPGCRHCFVPSTLACFATCAPREPHRADDIAGETWVAVAAQIGTFDGGVGPFTAWLFTIARQRLADDRRTRSRRQTNPVADVPDDRAARSGEESALDITGAQQAVDFIVRHLTRDQADVVLLRVLGDLSAREVAAVLGRDENWVRVTHHRAIARLKDQAPIAPVVMKLGAETILTV